jgi:death-on-curing protein
MDGSQPITFRNQQVREEYERIVGLVGPADPYAGKYSIGLHEVLQAHYLLVDFFTTTGEGIGGVGPKNMTLLHSALSRQFVEFGGKPKYSDRIDVCASLMFGLIKNHPFHDANKRTAFLVSLLHLQKCGRTPTVSQKEYEDFTVDIADHRLCYYQYAQETSLSGADLDVYVISRFLKRSTRQIDKRPKQITYNQLKTILRQRGLDLVNPNGNRIDLVRYKDVDGTELNRPKRIAHIGFHGWSREVSKKDIDIVREASRLDARHGYDSQTFFNGLDGPLELIVKYKEPLERLAFR